MLKSWRDERNGTFSPRQPLTWIMQYVRPDFDASRVLSYSDDAHLPPRVASSEDHVEFDNDAAMSLFAMLDPAKIALIFDVDGTLIELGPTPFDVRVPDSLRTALSRLVELTGGALALCSGRPIRDLDLLFAPLRLPAIGGHGAEMRLPDGASGDATLPLPLALRERLAALATPGSRIVIEDKGYSVALHYRQAPEQEQNLIRHIAACTNDFPQEATEVMLGKALFEVKRPAINKGNAVRVLMASAPYAGRKPVFLGDDVTDESVFAILQEFGGIGFSVGREFEGLAGAFESPAHVRIALQRLIDTVKRPDRA